MVWHLMIRHFMKELWMNEVWMIWTLTIRSSCIKIAILECLIILESLF